MKKIYSQCSKVTIYLGDGENHRPRRGVPARPGAAACATFHGDDRDLRYIEAFWDDLASSQRLSSSFHLFCLIRILTSRDLTSTLAAKLSSSKVDHLSHLAESLRMMLISPWWQRIWVVQEVVVSKRAFIQYGPVSAPWEMLVAALPQIPTTSFPLDSAKVLAYFARYVRDFEYLRSEWHSRGGAPLLSLLQSFSSRRASDERDKVFALLGLVTKSQQGLVRPNYVAEVTEVYRSTALALVRDSGTFSIWNGDVARKNAMNLPSWIPDWSAACEETDRRRTQVTSSYNACGNWALSLVESHSAYLSYVAKGLEKLAQFKFLQPFERDGDMLHPGLGRALGRYQAKLWEYEQILEAEFTKGGHGRPMEAAGDMNELRTLSSRVRNSCSRLRNFCSPAGHRATPHQHSELRRLSGHMFGRSPVLCGEIGKMRPIKVLRPVPTTEVEFDPPIWTGEELLTVPRQLWVPELEANHVLVVETMAIGKVTKVAQRLITWSDLDSALTTLYSWVMNFDVAHGLDFARTLVADALVLTGGESSSTGQGSNIKLRRLNADDDEQLRSWVNRIVGFAEQRGDYAAKHFRVDEDMKGFDEALVLATEGRVLFLLESFLGPKRLFGLGPGSMAQGDEVRVLPGGKNYTVLRPAAVDDSKERLNEFTVVGDCYLDSEDERNNSQRHLVEPAPDFDSWKADRGRPWPGWLPPDVLAMMKGEHELDFSGLDVSLQRRQTVYLT